MKKERRIERKKERRMKMRKERKKKMVVERIMMRGKEIRAEEIREG